jgi:predicted XRE-type DNA-binding protein
MKTKLKKNIEELEYEKRSGNVFADLGFENPEEELAKSDLTPQISSIIRKRKLTQSQVAEILGVDQPRISSLLTGRFDLFLFDMLIHFLKFLGQDIEIVVKPKPRNRKLAHLSVVSPGERVSVSMVASSR